MIEQRANSFLQIIRKSQQGKLKIYLGYCAGVGKTYQMLQEANRLQKEGVNVVVGYVETHGRVETEALLSGLTVLPRHSINYRGILITEMDLDTILNLHPEVVMVDELAHSNVPGSKNTKRYQDVEEILAAGIHVITTMNVQHLESLFDTIETATKVKVRERVPDRLLVEADQIVNVDVSIEDLITRMKEGKIYVPEGITSAMANFFIADNLEQLRELTLRELASQIDFRRRDHLEDEAHASLDQVMVCLSSRGANCDKLLRFTSRLAGRLNRNWYAVYVQTPSEKLFGSNSTNQNILSETLRLAQQLGATVFTYKGEDIVDTILQFAEEYRVGHIVIGTPAARMSLWKRVLGRKNIAERLFWESKSTTIIVFDTRVNKEQNTPESKVKKQGKPAQAAYFDIKHPLRTGKVVIWDNFIDWSVALKELIQAACETVPNLSVESVWEKIMVREQQGSTYLKEEVRFPHCRIEGIPHPLLVIGIAKAGVLDSSSGTTSKLIFLLVSPAEDPNIHIQIIGYLARFCRDDILVKQLLESKTPADAQTKLEAWDT